MDDKVEESKRIALFSLGPLDAVGNEMGTLTSTMGFDFLFTHALQGFSFVSHLYLGNKLLVKDRYKVGKSREQEWKKF